jgi:CubicO group peptidase (beta-lactamase class C family)
MNQTDFSRAQDLLAEAVHQRQITAGSLVVIQAGTPVVEAGFGYQHPTDHSHPVDADSTFLLASITKPVTVLALMLLVERGLVSLGDPVRQHLPEFVGEDRSTMRILHLLTHTSGMRDMLPNNIDLRQAHAPQSTFVQHALEARLLFSPGSDFRYQSKGILLVAEIVERLTGQRLREFLRTDLLGPLGMDRSSLGLGERSIDETVYCGVDPEDERFSSDWGHNSPYWRDFGCPWGGLHASARDVARLLQAVVTDGGGAISPATCRRVRLDHNVRMKAPWGLGWGLRDSRVWNYFGNLCSEETFGHTGSTGTVAWADPKTHTVCVILTNQMVGEGRLLRRVSNAVAAQVKS